MIQTKTETNFANFTGKHFFNKVTGLRKILPKTNISYPLMRTRTCVYQGVNVNFSENFSQGCNFIKRLQHRCFPVIFAKIICESYLAGEIPSLILGRNFSRYTLDGTSYCQYCIVLKHLQFLIERKIICLIVNNKTVIKVRSYE